jgi:DNA modification methylase
MNRRSAMTEPYYADDTITLYAGDSFELASALEPGSVQCIVTSPPYYGLRDYNHPDDPDQIGSESSIGEYVEHLVGLFRRLRTALADDGVVWLNIGDTYAGRANAGPAYDGNRGKGRPGQMPKRKRTTSDAPYKSLIGVPWRVAIALIDDGWILRSEVIWSKPNPMPESVLDRPTKSHEQMFMLTKNPQYLYDAAAIAEEARSSDGSGSRFGGVKYGDSTARETRTKSGREYVATGFRNKRDVWEVAPAHFTGSHFAVMPEALIVPCVLSSSRVGDTVLDPFSGSGTTGQVATMLGRKYIGMDISADYLDLSLKERFAQPPLGFGAIA